jgi:hypothetical protein
MKRRFRVALLACAGAASLMSTGSAFAEFVPQLQVSQVPARTGSAGVSHLRFTIPREHDALFKVTFYAPAGYTANLTAAAGTQLGTVAAQAQVREPIAGAVLPLTGTLVAENPANFTTSPCAPGLHGAVWTIVLPAPGVEPLRVPVYVDQTTGAEATFASTKMQICLPSPHIPASAGGATFGAKVIQAVLQVQGVFTSPTARGEYVWRAVATPWAPPATPNVPGTVQAKATIGLPASLTINARVTSRARRTVLVSGRLTEGGEGISRARVQVFVNNRRPARVTTGGNGRYAVTMKMARRGTYSFRATSAVAARSETCSDPAPLPLPCVSQNAAFYAVASSTVRARIGR